MVDDLSGRLLLAEGQAKDVLVRNAGPGDPRALPEAEAAIEIRITNEDTSSGVPRPHDVEARLDQGPPDPPALVVRMDRHRSHDKPPRRRVADRARRERDVSHHGAVHLSHERQLQGAVGPQGVDDEGLRAAAIRMPGESQAHEFPDGVDVGRLF